MQEAEAQNHQGPQSKKPLLTEHLLSITNPENYKLATQHLFLQAARTQSLDSALLSLWLSQDRIYAAHGYPRFIGGLITKIPFSSEHSIDGERERKNQRILSVLTYSLENVVREADFFMKSAQKYGLNIEGWKERAATRAYCAEMARLSGWGSLEEGLVFLWAMEKLYLDSWTFVAQGLPDRAAAATQNSTNQAIHDFAKNWSNKEFIKFVDDLAELVDDLNIDPDSELGARAKRVWERVVELEIEFWPQAGEDVQMRINT
ncbi:heme oxygenase-like protein [Fomitiporia mediterranea MF3/22]|uniref:heme oxygenase-like protein n=1 Tax=Fomitiporia mediterranea (strain MF3/22) TaxID=694068 RepID=UPI00044089F1|nr:heme oxygenase-like protein [Fomitiporia mediterranea MF3/22]EJD02562.1 heme oxygenase-like protein [Fomitiporia mediterranea MF3/22]